MRPFRFSSLTAIAASFLASLVAFSVMPLAAFSVMPPAAWAAVAPASSNVALGQPAPARTMRMKNVGGADLSIAEAAGKKGTLVFFICNHCPWVKAWQGRIATIGNAALAKGVGVIAINSNDPIAFPEDSFDQMRARAKSVGYKFPYVMDASSDVGRAFGATHTPEVYLFDASGKLVYHGAVDDNAHEPNAVQHTWLRDAVDAVASGKAVPVAETKALGCGIKLREKAPNQAG